MNDPPVVTMTAAALVFTEGNGAAAVDPGLTVTDADSANLAAPTVAITANFVTGEDASASPTQNGITGSFNADDRRADPDGHAPRWPTTRPPCARSPTPTPARNPSTATRSVRVVATDGIDDLQHGARGITVTAVNNPPW